jgi:integrase
MAKTQGKTRYRCERLNFTKILSRRELAAVLADLHRKAPRAAGTKLNLVIFRLATCCGLRVSEIASLRMEDINLALPRPYLRVTRSSAKGGKPRVVPLHWDSGTLDDLTGWYDQRLAGGAAPSDVFVGSPRKGSTAGPLSRHTVRKRFLTACRCLGADRVSTLTIHHGRHSFISHALAGGRTLAEVRDGAGHANVSITSTYLHIVVDEDEGIGDLFGVRPSRAGVTAASA